MLDKLETLQDAAIATQQSTIPSLIEERYNNAVASAGRKLWRGTIQVMASGFGKGMLVLAAAAVILGAMGGGALAIGGSEFVYNGVLAKTFEQGAIAGAKLAFSFLTTNVIGLLTLAVGGTLGAVTETRMHQNRISAEAAKAQAVELARAREENEQKRTSGQSAGIPAAMDKNCSFCELEAQRRQQQAQGIGR